MKEIIQAPIPKEQFRQWIEDANGAFMGVQQRDGRCLTVHNDAVLPEITVLFAGEAGKFNDTVEICGMYDNRTREFGFISSRLASLVDGITEPERWKGIEDSGKIYDEISRCAQEAVEQREYRFKDQPDAQYALLRQTAQTCLSAMTDYAAALAAKGEADAVQDVRDLAEEMLHFWREPVYEIYERGYPLVEQKYLERFAHAVSTAASGQVPAFSGEQAAEIFKGLALHAEEAAQNEDAFSVWECCRLAGRLSEDYPGQGGLFRRNFTEDYSEQFTQFGSRDQAHLQESWLFGKPAILFNRPVPEEQIPEGWHSYHLSGRNLRYADTLQKSIPEKGYVGTMLSPYVLIRASYQSRQIKDAVISPGGDCCLEEFCDRNHLPEPDMSGIFPEQQTQSIEMGGMM